MLEMVDLNADLDKETYGREMNALEVGLGQLQRDLRSRKIPVLLVLEGWDAAGQEDVLNRILQAWDPRGYKVHFTQPAEQHERRLPALRRFWLRLPALGEIVIFDRSWYLELIERQVEEGWTPLEVQSAYERIRRFERQLADDGIVILKFFLHLSPGEQAERLRKLRKHEALSWKAGEEERRRHKRYPDYLPAFENMLQETSTAQAPWHALPATSRRFATWKMADILAAAFQTALLQPDPATAPIPRRSVRRSSPFDQVDLNKAVSQEEYDARLAPLQEEVRDLQHLYYQRKTAIVIVYEGWDTAGKGSNIRRVVRQLDPRFYEVVPVSAPTGAESERHYLWRFWRGLPKRGHIAIFDRSWYGRVLVERVEGFARPCEWERAYREITEFETDLVEWGTPVIKFWLHISKDVQLERLQERQQNPRKQWKITDEDWRNREKWDEYWVAASEMVERTSTQLAPWFIVEGNSKLHARLQTLTIIRDQLRAHLNRG
jgi:polyphosphate:AMP phosphotransferase